MKTKYFIFAALAGMTFAGCSSDDFIAETPPVNNVDEGMAPILFTSNQKAFTRADYVGADAANLLNNKFVVTGFKGESTKTPGSIVFDNYTVTYAANTANTTASNSNNWEYVGNTPIKWAADNGITSQTIKYWDYSKSQYDFIAWGMGKYDGTNGITPVYNDETTDLAEHSVRVSAIVPNGTTKTWPTAADPAPANLSYTFEGKAVDLAQCYISDIVTVKKSGAGQYGEVEGYGQPVTLKFRQLGTKVRIALYETVPGYSVKDVKFYSGAATNDASADAAKIFTTTANQIYTEGKYYVYFPTMDSPNDPDNNQAHIKFTEKTGTTQATTVSWGAVNYSGREEAEKLTTNSYLGRTSNTASFAGEPGDNYYVFYLPNETGTNLNLRVNYTLESIDGSGEEILVQGATAQVPSIYTTWKPGYAYTYLFKISDKTNGYTGVYDPTKPDDTSVNSDPAGLYPITFDAIVVNAEEDATQETITLVSTPSITTYQNGSNVVNNNEYTVLSASGKITGEIYVTVNDADAASYTEVAPQPEVGSSVAKYYTKDGDNYIACATNDKATDGTTYYKKIEPALPNGTLATLTSKAALYEVDPGTTEAEVIDALQMQDDDFDTGTIKGRNKKVLTTSIAPNNLTLTNEVTYGADGNTITVSTDQAAKFIPKASTTYAFVYTKTAATGDGTPMYEPIAFTDATVTTKYRYATTPVGTAGDVQKDVVYFAPTGSTPALAMKSVFLGQGAGNLFVDNSDTKEAAGTEFAKTGTTYYYTLDNGSTYLTAKNIAYADFNKTGDDQLYVKSGNYYVQKPSSETEPVDGTAYYYRTGSEGSYVYTYCVILPEQTATTWFTQDAPITYVKVENSETEIGGMTYFDKYTKNNGVYYTKVIKVQ